VIKWRSRLARILDFLADGMTEAELLSDYPQLTRKDVIVAVASRGTRAG
jgi:uncharacterized protein (DUF433 family)